jgi:Methane oxygenase PmoA
MKIKLTLILVLLSSVVFAQKGVKLTHNKEDKKVNVSIDGKPFTAYFYPSEDILKKAVLFPILTYNGNHITRGWPFEPRAGERIDHPHHVGMWLNYEAVNGYDYWNNSTAIKPEERLKKYGTIRHTGIESMKSGKNSGELIVTADWQDKDGTGTLTAKEKTKYVFWKKGESRIIDRITTLTAETDIEFKDIKDGMFAIRVARQLEHPSKTPEVFTDANGIATNVPTLDNTGITGNYRNSNGIEGEETWGKRAKWVNLRGKIEDETVNLVIIDHPKNVGYPTYWHTRGYGLFSANSLGQKALSGGKEVLDFKLKKGESTTFRFRTIVASESLSDEAVNQLMTEFEKLY